MSSETTASNTTKPSTKIEKKIGRTNNKLSEVSEKINKTTNSASKIQDFKSNHCSIKMQEKISLTFSTNHRKNRKTTHSSKRTLKTYEKKRKWLKAESSKES